LRAGARRERCGIRRGRNGAILAGTPRAARRGAGAGGEPMKLNLFLIAALVALVAANLGIGDNPARRNFEAMPEMVRSVAYKSCPENPNFFDGKPLQLPPEGTIPRAGVQGPARPGAVVYQTYCLPCHGPAGKGDGLVAMRGFPPPPSFLTDHALGLTD